MSNVIKFNVKLQTWCIAMICFSYPFFITIFIVLGIPTGLANFVVKGSLIVLLLISFFTTSGTKGLAIDLKLLISFFIIYGIRLLSDTSAGISNVYYSNSYIYIYFFILTVFPCLILIWSRESIDIEFYLKVFFLVIILSNLAYFYYSVTNSSGSFSEQFSGRLNVESSQVGDFYTTIINPISVGRFGALLSLLCLHEILFSKKSIFTKEKLIFITLFFIGIINIFLGSSRGPFFTFFIFALFILYSYLRNVTISLKFLVKIILFIFCLLIFLNFYIFPFLNSNDVFLIQRVEQFFQLLDFRSINEVRNYSYAGALKDFMDMPFFGKQFVGTYDNFYPHNIILEVFMSVGFIGGLFFLIPLFNIVIHFLKVLFTNAPNKIFSFYILGLSFLFFSLTSGSIYTSPEFWVLLTLLIIISKKKNLYYNIYSIKK